MKYICAVILALALQRGTCFPGETNLLAIYLAAGSGEADILAQDTNALHKVQLSAEPILSDKDFTSYNPSNHWFAITADAARRMARRLNGHSARMVGSEPALEFGWSDMPFVLVASGERVYTGMLSTSVFLRDFLLIAQLSNLRCHMYTCARQTL